MLSHCLKYRKRQSKNPKVKKLKIRKLSYNAGVQCVAVKNENSSKTKKSRDY